MPSGVYERRNLNGEFISEATKEAVRRDYSIERNYSAVARAYGMNKGTVWKIVRGDWNPGRKRRPSGK